MAELLRDEKIRLFDILKLDPLLKEDEKQALKTNPDDTEIKIKIFDDFFANFSSVLRASLVEKAYSHENEELSESDIALLDRYATEFLEIAPHQDSGWDIDDNNSEFRDQMSEYDEKDNMEIEEVYSKNDSEHLHEINPAFVNMNLEDFKRNKIQMATNNIEEIPPLENEKTTLEEDWEDLSIIEIASQKSELEDIDLERSIEEELHSLNNKKQKTSQQITDINNLQSESGDQISDISDKDAEEIQSQNTEEFEEGNEEDDDDEVSAISKSSPNTETEKSTKQTTSLLESAAKAHMKLKELMKKTYDHINDMTLPDITLPEIDTSSIFKSRNFQSKPQESTQGNIQTRFNIIKEKVYAFLNQDNNIKPAPKEKTHKKNNAIEMTPISLSGNTSQNMDANIEANFGNTKKSKAKNDFIILPKQQTFVDFDPEISETIEPEPIEINRPNKKTENFLSEQLSENHFNQPRPKDMETFENILFLDNRIAIRVVKSDKSNDLSSRFQAAQKKEWTNENKSFEIVAVKQDVRQNSSSQQQAASEKFVLVEKTKHNPDPIPKLEVFKGVVTSCPGQLEAAKTLKSQQELAYLMIKTFQLFPNKSGVLEVRGGTPEFRQIIKDEALKQGFPKEMIKLEGIELPAQTSSTKEKTRDELPQEEYHSSMTPQ